MTQNSKSYTQPAEVCYCPREFCLKGRFARCSDTHRWWIITWVSLALIAVSLGCSVPTYRGQFNRIGGSGVSERDNPVSSIRASGVLNNQAVVSLNAAGELTALNVNVSTSAPSVLTKLTTQPVIAATFDSSATRLALVMGSSIEVWERDPAAPVSSWDIVAEWAGRIPLVESLAFSPTDGALLVGGADGHIYLWRYRSPTYRTSAKFLRGGRRELIQRYVGHNSPVTSLVFHPSGYTFFSGDEQGVVSSWRRYDDDAYQGGLDSTAFGIRYQQELARRVSPSRVSSEPITAVRLSQNGEWLAVFAESGLTELWQTRGMNMVASFQVNGGLLLDGAFVEVQQKSAQDSSDWRFSIAALGRLGSVRHWQLHLRKTVDGWKFDNDELETEGYESVQSLGITKDGRGIAEICAIIPGTSCVTIRP